MSELVTNCNRLKPPLISQEHPDGCFFNGEKMRYNHKANLLEYTKILERYDVDTLTFQRKISRAWAGGSQKKVSGTWGGDYNPTNKGTNPSGYQIPSPQPTAGLQIPAIYLGYNSNVIIDSGFNCWKTTVYLKYPTGNEEKIAELKTDFWSDPETTPGSIIAYKTGLEKGTYEIVYEYNPRTTSTRDYVLTYAYKIEIEESAAFSTEEQPVWNCYEVCQKILSAGILRRVGIDPQLFFIDPEQVSTLQSITAPEFPMIQKTLFEALLTVGKFVHAIPRCLYPTEERLAALVQKYGNSVATDTVKGIIHFDFLGGSDVYELPDNAQLVWENELAYCDEYCDEIDATVNNLVCTTDKDEASITYPYFGGVSTVRTTVGAVRISNDTAIFGHFPEPIYKPIKLYLRWGDRAEVDATAYLYEKSEYDTLSRYAGDEYPYTIAYAIYWTQFGTTIEGLTEKIETATSITQPWQRKAIINILRSLYSTEDILDTDNLVDNLYFRFEYISVSSARVKQRKPLYKGATRNSLIYQQASSLTETALFGENMKGAIARMGNPSLMRTYKFRRLAEIPTIGQLFPINRADGSTEYMYVAQVSRRFYPMAISATITLTPDFNRIGAYYAIDSEYRTADVSQTQYQERYSNYSEDIVLSHNPLDSDKKTMVTTIGQKMYRSVLTQEDNGEDVTTAVIQGESSIIGETPLKVATPVVSFSLGYSMVFSLKCSNNYGVGWQSNESGSASAGYRVQKQVPYADSYGDISKLSLKIGTSGFRGEGLKDFPNTFPELRQADMVSLSISTGDNPFDFQKNSGESINLTYQLHHRKDTASILIGTALSKYNPLITSNRTARPVLYFFKRRLNDLTCITETDVDRATLASNEVEFSFGGKRAICFEEVENTTNETFQSWAVIHPKTRELFFGENMTIAPGDATKAIYFNF